MTNLGSMKTLGHLWTCDWSARFIKYFGCFFIIFQFFLFQSRSHNTLQIALLKCFNGRFLEREFEIFTFNLVVHGNCFKTKRFLKGSKTKIEVVAAVIDIKNTLYRNKEGKLRKVVEWNGNQRIGNPKTRWVDDTKTDLRNMNIPLILGKSSTEPTKKFVFHKLNN